MSKLTDLQFVWTEKRKADCAAILLAGLQSLMEDGLNAGEAQDMPDAVAFVEAFMEECGDAPELREDVAYTKALLGKFTVAG